MRVDIHNLAKYLFQIGHLFAPRVMPLQDNVLLTVSSHLPICNQISHAVPGTVYYLV